MTSIAGKQSSLIRTERSAVSVSDFQKEMFRLEDMSESKNFLVYADSNVGKTVLAGTCPGKTFWLAGEPGYKSAAMQGAKGSGVRITDTATAWAAIEFLEGKAKNGKPRYSLLDWVVLDGLSTMQDRFRFGYAAEAFDINPTKRQHRNLPDKPDYFNTQNMVKAWVARLVDMPVNLLVTAHAFRTDRTENGELLVFPGVQGKVNETANAVAGLMDVTGYYEKKRVRVRNSEETRIVRRLWFETPARETEVRYTCGDKFNRLGPYMDAPTMPKLLAKINGEERVNA